MPLYVVHITVTGPFRARGWVEKLACVIEPIMVFGTLFVLFRLALQYNFMDYLLTGWIWALPFTVVIANLRRLSEHTQLDHKVPPDPLQSTRSFKTNALVRFFFNNQNHHLEHHLFPNVPWNNLGKVHKLLQPVYAERQAATTTSYLPWLAGALGKGPNSSMHYQNGRAIWNE